MGLLGESAVPLWLSAPPPSYSLAISLTQLWDGLHGNTAVLFTGLWCRVPRMRQVWQISWFCRTETAPGGTEPFSWELTYSLSSVWATWMPASCKSPIMVTVHPNPRLAARKDTGSSPGVWPAPPELYVSDTEALDALL